MVAGCSSLRLDDFAGGEIAGAPHVPAPDRAPWSPFFPAPLHLLALREEVGCHPLSWLEAEKGEREALANAVVVDRQDVRAAEAEDEKHLDGPAADAAHLGKVLDDVLVRHLLDHGECGNGSVEGFGGEIAEGEHLVFREASRAELFVGAIEQMLRRGVDAETAERLEAGEETSVDGRGGLAVKLLIDDGLGQGLEG